MMALDLEGWGGSIRAEKHLWVSNGLSLPSHLLRTVEACEGLLEALSILDASTRLLRLQGIAF